jgi:hypothetical protein
MEKITKEAWTQNKNNLSPEALEKRKSINKKILKFGCLPIIIFFILILIIANFSDSPETEKNNEKSTTINEQDVKENQRIEDSLNTVKLQNKEKAKKELNTFRKNIDEFKGTTFYEDPRIPNFVNTNFIFPYIGEKENEFWLRLKFQYASEDWLFIQKGIFLIDGEQFVVTGNWERDNNAEIWEWLDIIVGESEEKILEKIANSKSAKIRYEGMQYHDDREITNKEKNIIKKTLELYKSLK